MSNDGTVTRDSDAHVVDSFGERHPLVTLLHYRSADPFAVVATFIAPQRPSDPGVVWTLARDLLAHARVGAVGEGDVHGWMRTGHDGGPVLALLLMSPDGQALVELPMDDVDAFLDATYALVPDGAEAIEDMDVMLAELLADQLSDQLTDQPVTPMIVDEDGLH